MGVAVLVFAVELQKVRTKCISSDDLKEDWWEFQNGMYGGWKRGRKHWKIRFYRIYIEISQLGRNVIKMALKWKSKWVSTDKFNIHYRGSPGGSELSNTRTAYNMHIPNKLSLILTRKNRKRQFK